MKYLLDFEPEEQGIDPESIPERILLSLKASIFFIGGIKSASVRVLRDDVALDAVLEQGKRNLEDGV